MNNKKVLRIVYKILGIGLFLVVLSLCTSCIMRVTKDKANYLKYQQFYEEKENFDVLFFGSSRILDAVYPMELWSEYGLTSYNMAQHAERLSISYWQMKNAFAYNKPKVAVVDLSIITAGKITDTDTESKSYLHKSLDHMPFSILKYNAIKDLTEGVDVWEYLFPYAMYHHRWTQLAHVDFYTEDYPLRKGAESRVRIEKLSNPDWSSDEVAPQLDIEAIYLDKIVALCKEQGVELIFTMMPSVHVTTSPDFCALVNAMEKFAETEGVRFLNFAKNDDFLNYELDFSDASHLNPSGGKKLTKLLGQQLIENYTFSQKSDSTIAKWSEHMERYMGTKLGEIKVEQRNGNLLYFLLLMNDDDFSFEIRMHDESDITERELEAIFEELGITKEDVAFDMDEEAVEITVYRTDKNEFFHKATFY